MSVRARIHAASERIPETNEKLATIAEDVTSGQPPTVSQYDRILARQRQARGPDFRSYVVNPIIEQAEARTGAE
jgi:hypothetical protein